jgi:signal transduction histidine kinase
MKDNRRTKAQLLSELAELRQRVAELETAEAERKRAEEAEREQRVLAEALRDAAAALNSTLELDKVLDLLLANVGRVVPHDAANITLIDERGEARIARARGYAEQALEKILSLRLPTASTPNLRRMAETAQPVFMPDTHADPAWIKREEFMWVRSYAGMPIRLKGQVIGFLNLESATPGFFTPAHTDHLRAFADQAAIAIENARLYNEASRYAEELEQQAMDLQARNEELDAFAHTVAHDLKNPVGLVIGFAEILAQGYTAMSDDERKRCVQAVMQQGHKMNDIIDDLLLLAQVRKMQVEGEPLDMERVVAEALQGLANMVEQYQADIRTSPDWTAALGYAPWVEAVWANYISNAIKYGGRPPHIELGATAQDDGMVRFWVRDNGAGLTLEEQTRLFIPFTRLDQVQVKGHGLGLSIVRRIVEKLGGQVGVESQVGQGSVFSFTLPGHPVSS